MGGGRWFWTAKMFFSSFAHMLICALKFVCEHSFTCQFCALMPKISKENFAHNFLTTFSKHSHNFLTTFSKLSHKFLKTD